MAPDSEFESPKLSGPGGWAQGREWVEYGAENGDVMVLGKSAEAGLGAVNGAVE